MVRETRGKRKDYKNSKEEGKNRGADGCENINKASDKGSRPEGVLPGSAGSSFIGLDIGVFAVKGVLIEAGNVVKKVFLPAAGNPAEAAVEVLRSLAVEARENNLKLGVTGNNARLITGELNIKPVLEIEALQTGLSFFGEETEKVLSLGHENMYYLELSMEEGKDSKKNNDIIEDKVFKLNKGSRVTFFNRNGQCAAGSGSFWYQQATRMGFNDKEMAEVALEAPSAVKISGRCAVFAKSDMTHAINEGASQSAVAAGLAKALVDLVVDGVAQNRIKGPGRLLLMGGVAKNRAILKYLGEYCIARDAQLYVPADQEFINAAGAALKGTVIPEFSRVRNGEERAAILTAGLLRGVYRPEKPLPPLPKEQVIYEPATGELKDGDYSTVYIGVDCGSVSTKCALMDAQGRYIGGIYLPTAGRPALQVLELMKKVRQSFAAVIKDETPLVICTTGSGRFLARKILNARYAVDEITCQAEGVKSLCPEESLSIIEIGGEDSKFVQIKDGILFDYNMNPVCAAGTGTFLENLSELLGVKIKDEFSRKAFQAGYAIDLGDTCTLLSQSTLVSAASRGLPPAEQLASLAYSSARNYLSRTVEGRTLEGKLIFTGATARNHALAAAFAAECGRGITVPPHPELTGAIGAALAGRSLWLEEGAGAEKPPESSIGHLNEFTVEKKPCRASCTHEHNCRLDVITFSDKSKFIYGDRCGRYSEMEKAKESTSLPDYEPVRKEIFEEAAEQRMDRRDKNDNSAIANLQPAVKDKEEKNSVAPNPQTSGSPEKSADTSGTSGGKSAAFPAPTVGIACSGLYHELYPFWSAYFKSLGAELVLSGDSDEKILEKGKADLAAEMCYPIEVLMGHYRKLTELDPDFIFIPEVHDMPALPWAKSWTRSLSCPLLMMIKGVTVHSLNIPEEKVLNAALNYREGKKAISKQLLPVTRKLLGKNFSALRHQKAVLEAYFAQDSFQQELEKEGKRIIEELRTGDYETIALILGRSYTLYDPFVSKDLIKHAARRGLMAVSQDFLLEYLRGWYTGRIESSFLEPYRREFGRYMEEMTENMGNIYAIQLQQILSAALAARFINERADSLGFPRLNPVLQDPFRCGPNSMLRHHLSNICGYLRLTLDEHTAPAGMITRLEAFKNTCRANKKPVATTFYSAKTTSATDKRIKKVLIPNSSGHPKVVAAIIESRGIPADVLPRGNDKDLTLARRYTNGEECLPFIQNMQDYLEYAEANFERTGDSKGNPIEKCQYNSCPNITVQNKKTSGPAAEEGVYLFQGWACGPCRYGLYAPIQSMLLNRAGYGPGRIASFKPADATKRFGPEFLILSFDGMLTIDLLYKMLHQTRPYEQNAGQSQKIFDRYSQKVYDLMRNQRFKLHFIITGNHLKGLEKIISEAAIQFSTVPLTGEPLRPRIMVAGEFYVRIDDRCNQDIVSRIEEAGGEASIAPATEFFIYTCYANYRKAKKDYLANKNPVTYLNKKVYETINRLAHRDEHRLQSAAALLLKGHEEPDAWQIRESASRYIPEHTAGEPPMTVGRTGAMIDRERMAGAIFVGPFTCMPASVVEAQQATLSDELGIPIISVYYDGRDNANRDEFIQSLVFQAKQNLR